MVNERFFSGFVCHVGHWPSGWRPGWLRGPTPPQRVVPAKAKTPNHQCTLLRLPWPQVRATQTTAVIKPGPSFAALACPGRRGERLRVNFHVLKKLFAASFDAHFLLIAT